MPQIEFQPQQMMKRLHTRLLVMYAEVALVLDSAAACLAGADRAKAAELIAGDSEIDALEMEIDDIALSILVRTHALASDLRLVLGALRIINDLERIGDEAVIIAQRVVGDTPEECAAINTICGPLIALARQCVKQAFDIFKAQDAGAAAKLCDAAATVNQTEVKIVQGVINRLADQDPTLTPGEAIQGMMICRSLTRICKRAFNLAEQTYFIYTGKNIKHAGAQRHDGYPE